jgi:uncharacterized protein (TIGR02284 family)
MSNEEIIDTLNDLIETCKDGEYGFEQSAEYTRDAELKTLFRQRADDCRRGLQELNALVSECGGTPEDSGSVAGALHRGWVTLRQSISGNEDHAILAECERGEDVAKARYRKALEQNLPEPVRAVVQKQFEGVQRNHDQIKALRDRYKNAAA